MQDEAGSGPERPWQHLSEDELMLIRSSEGRILKPGLTGDGLAEAYRELADWSAEMAQRVEKAPASEVDSASDEALEFVRPRRA